MNALTALAAIACIALFTSCGTPAQRAARVQAKVGAAKVALMTNTIAQAGLAAVYVHGAEWALNQETNKTPMSTAANDLLLRAETLLPEPSLADSLTAKQAVTNSVARNALDERGYRMDSDQTSWETKLTKAEAKSDKAMTEIAAEATTWHKLKAWAWWIGGGFLGLFGLTLIMPALSIAFPAFAPFGAIIGNVAGAILKIPFKLIPQAVKGAGFVAAEVHEKSDDTVKALVLAIEKAKAASPAAAEALKPQLLDATSKDWERPVIEAAKATLNLK